MGTVLSAFMLKKETLELECIPKVKQWIEEAPNCIHKNRLLDKMILKREMNTKRK